MGIPLKTKQKRPERESSFLLSSSLATQGVGISVLLLSILGTKKCSTEGGKRCFSNEDPCTWYVVCMNSSPCEPTRYRLICFASFLYRTPELRVRTNGNMVARLTLKAVCCAGLVFLGCKQRFFAYCYIQ